MDIRFTRLPVGYELQADIGPHRRIACRINPPAGRVGLVDILPDVFALADALAADAIQAARERGQTVACGKGCALCCRQLVALSDHEALLAAHMVGLLNPDVQGRIRQAFAATLARLEDQKLLAEMLDSHANAFADAGRIIAVQRRYWELQIACPFLIDEACAIYPYRPLLCRRYLVTSPREHCHDSFTADHRVKKLPLAYDLASAAASFDGLAARPSRPVALPTLLLVNGLLQGHTRPQTSATAMLTAFLRHAAEHFAR
ncbi:YkgJ family cysteine cluster protein [Solidesulfovibrio sp.]